MTTKEILESALSAHPYKVLRSIDKTLFRKSADCRGPQWDSMEQARMAIRAAVVGTGRNLVTCTAQDVANALDILF